MFSPQFGTSPTGHHYAFQSFLNVHFTYNQSKMAVRFTITSHFIHKQVAGIALSVCDYTIERTAVRQTQKEVLHYVQTGCEAGQPQIHWVPIALPTRLQQPGSEVPGLGVGGATPSFPHASVSYKFGSFWTAVPIHQTTRFHIQEAHNFNIQWRDKYKPQNPSSILPWHVPHCRYECCVANLPSH